MINKGNLIFKLVVFIKIKEWKTSTKIREIISTVNRLLEQEYGEILNVKETWLSDFKTAVRPQKKQKNQKKVLLLKDVSINSNFLSHTKNKAAKEETVLFVSDYFYLACKLF